MKMSRKEVFEKEFEDRGFINEVGYKAVFCCFKRCPNILTMSSGQALHNDTKNDESPEKWGCQSCNSSQGTKTFMEHDKFVEDNKNVMDSHYNYSSKLQEIRERKSKKSENVGKVEKIKDLGDSASDLHKKLDDEIFKRFSLLKKECYILKKKRKKWKTKKRPIITHSIYDYKDESENKNSCTILNAQMNGDHLVVCLPFSKDIYNFNENLINPDGKHAYDGMINVKNAYFYVNNADGVSENGHVIEETILMQMKEMEKNKK